PPGGCAMAPTPIVETGSRVAVGAGLGVSGVAVGAAPEGPGVTTRGGAGGAGACLGSRGVSDGPWLAGSLVRVAGALAGGALAEAAPIVVSISKVLVVGRRQV